jgi:oligoribonuclease NrnB/cAMP/cGMP phosphodiesterase (DHH superfamily)
MKCFYHSADLDGHCSGAIVLERYPDCAMIGINYGDPFPWNSIELGEIVFMVDFSLQPFSDMELLNSLCSLRWIDHHKTAIDARDVSAERDSFHGVQEVGLGACALVWRTVFPGVRMPYGVQLLAEYDVWKHDDANCLPFQHGMRLEDTLPGSSVWSRVFGGNLADIILRGETVLEYERKQSESYAKSCAFETEFMGLRCLAMNRMLTNSKAFDSVVDPDRHDAMLTFGFRKGRWTCSLYSAREDVDVSAVALQLGGGGHKGAAGFQCRELPFELARG